MSNYIAIKSLLNSYFIDALSFDTPDGQWNSREGQKLPLYQSRDHSRILYISGAALQLSKFHNQPTLEIASGIVSVLLAKGGEAFTLEIVPPGWIHLQLTQGFLAVWLQRLVVSNVKGEEEMGTRKITRHNSSRLFAIQYAHARCYSLLRLAHREGLIKLIDDGILLSAVEIPWLKDEQKLRFTHPAESRLIWELVRVIDNLECPDVSGEVNWKKLAWDLSQAFESFWCECRIWGKVKISAPELAQARLGLMIATQSVLRCLLVYRLGAVAPVEF